MADRPISFLAPMVRALLAGQKTQTRRVLMPQPQSDMGFIGIYAPKLTAVFGYATPAADCKIPLRYMPGDRLYVREAWCSARAYDDLAPSEMGGDETVKYAADDFIETRGWPHSGFRAGRHRAAMHMPRWASRITLIVTDVRVQRLHEITIPDILSEGIEAPMMDAPPSMTSNDDQVARLEKLCLDFIALWNSINPGRGFGWDSNPWVAALTFTVHRCNIDQIPGVER